MDAATRLIRAEDLANVDRGDFDMAVSMAIRQIGEADRYDPFAMKLLASKKLIAEMVAGSNGRFKHFIFSSGDDPTRFVNWTENNKRLN